MSNTHFEEDTDFEMPPKSAQKTAPIPDHVAAVADTLWFLPPPARPIIATKLAAFGVRVDADQATAAMIVVGSPTDGNWAARDIRPLAPPSGERPTVEQAVAQVERMALLAAVLQRSMPPGAPISMLVQPLDALGVRVHLDEATENIDGLADLQVLRVLRNAAAKIPELQGIAERAEHARSLAAKGDRTELDKLGAEMRARLLADQEKIKAAGNVEQITEQLADAQDDDQP